MSAEINDVAPKSLSHLVGQKSVIDQVSVAVDAAFADGRKMDHGLLVGPPGLGKSALAQVVAKEMAAEFHEYLGQSITSPADLNCVLLASQTLHTDDTPVKIRDAHKKLKHTGRFWTYVGDEEHPLTVCDYTPSRKRAGPAEFLKSYRGYLQADAFNGYDGIYLESNGQILEVGCWAHARRKVFDGRRADPAHAEAALAWIGKLYGIEKELRERTTGEWQVLPLADRFAQVAALRQERSRPLLSDFQRWLETESPKLVPKNPIRQAMDYTLSNWTALSRYVESGRLVIDNNAAENSLRGICLGRKNWLFCGSDRGGRAAAVYFSLIASCKRHDIDPFAYLRDILNRLPTLSSPDQSVLASLLPHRWQPA